MLLLLVACREDDEIGIALWVCRQMDSWMNQRYITAWDVPTEDMRHCINGGKKDVVVIHDIRTRQTKALA